MKTLDEVGGTLLWRGRGFLSRTYDLVRAEEEDPARAEPYATLRWREALILGRSRAELSAAAGAWRFVPEGLLGRQVQVLAEAGRPVATFRRAWRSGTLRFDDGRVLRWHRVDWLRRIWAFEDETGNEAARFGLRLSWTNTRATVELASTVSATERVLLAGFGFYLVRQSHAAARRAAA